MKKKKGKKKERKKERMNDRKKREEGATSDPRRDFGVAVVVTVKGAPTLTRRDRHG